MQMRKCSLAIFCALIALGGLGKAQALVLSPLTSFGGGDGWLDPSESSALGTGNFQRGMTYNSLNNHVYVADRDGGSNVRILDGDTGALITSLDMTGVSGGTFALNMIDVADDGAIYLGNLAIGANFKVYRWANESATPTVAFDATTDLPRVGDSFAVRGSGAGTQIIASGQGSTGFKLFTTADGVNFADAGTFGTTAASGAYRLGLDFISSTRALGLQPFAILSDADFSGGAANTNSVNTDFESPLAFDEVNNLLATIDYTSNDVRLYDGSDLSVLTSTGFMDLANNTTSPVSNGNGVGDLKFGTSPTGALRLYAMNTNNGIQAFNVVVPEPATIALLGLSLAGLLIGRRRS